MLWQQELRRALREFVERLPLYKYPLRQLVAVRTSPSTNCELGDCKPALDAISVAVMAEFALLPPRRGACTPNVNAIWWYIPGV